MIKGCQIFKPFNKDAVHVLPNLQHSFSLVKLDLLHCFFFFFYFFFFFFFFVFFFNISDFFYLPVFVHVVVLHQRT